MLNNILIVVAKIDIMLYQIFNKVGTIDTMLYNI